jgi:hypothetical protein
MKFLAEREGVWASDLWMKFAAVVVSRRGKRFESAWDFQALPSRQGFARASSCIML